MKEGNWISEVYRPHDIFMHKLDRKKKKRKKKKKKKGKKNNSIVEKHASFLATAEFRGFHAKRQPHPA